jgi:hypothetical protein
MKPPVGAGKCGRFADPVPETGRHRRPMKLGRTKNLKGKLPCRPWEQQMGLESWRTGKPQRHYERTSKLIQIQGLRQNSAQVLRYRSGGPEKTSLLDRGQQAIPLKSGGIARSSQPPRQFRRGSQKTPRKLQGPCQFLGISDRQAVSTKAISVADYAAQVIPFRSGSADPQGGFGELEKNLPRLHPKTR